MGQKQRTLKSTVRFDGVGLHSGATIKVEIRPAAANTGILFHRSDIPNSSYVRASGANVLDTTLATRIGPKESAISTVEHLLAAMFGLGIDNAVVDVSGPEMPILDGSAVPFLVLLDEAGVEELGAEKRLYVVRSVVEVVDPNHPDRFIRVEPSKQPTITYAIDFDRAAAIGKQSISLPLTGASLISELCYARTFCLEEDVLFMKQRGLARGGSMENAIVVNTQTGVMNQQGLRAPQEFVRHKALDCMGDLALLGMPLLGHVIAHKAGHDLHTALVKRLEEVAHAHEIIASSTRATSRFHKAFAFPTALDSALDSLALARIKG
jgi:UDP-3-O-[3-hydroxymyristoyl] N-acetylglucosamine deacetylase